ncbi:MAG TPA: HDIG domain-containing protein [Anaerolineales bacterium]|nr:HDIG domain-containing protein [Anaerolineales bacterium]
MSTSQNQRETRWLPGRFLWTSVLMVLVVGVAFVMLAFPQVTSRSATQLEVGRVAIQDIVAPRTMTFESEILTERQREAASLAIPPVYLPPETRIARQQLERLRATLAYISSVRADAYASPEQKQADLAAMEDIRLDQETVQRLLSLSDARWQAVQQEAITVVEQVLRGTIREDRLEEARREVPALVSLAFPEDQANIVANLVAGFVIPNSAYSPELTEAARQNARQTIEPVTQTFIQGETIVQRGQVATERDLEALRQFGLVQPIGRWQDLLSFGVATLLLVVYLLIYLRRNPALAQDLRGLTIIIFLFLLFLVGGRLLSTGQNIFLYLYPLSAFGLIVASLFGTQVALVFAFPLAILYAYNVPNAYELTLYNLFGSFLGILALGAGRRIVSYFWAALAIALAGMAVIVIFRAPQPNPDIVDVASLISIAGLNGIASSSLTILLQYFIAQMLGMTTALQLMEISRPDHPLLQFILRNAPGTYQHSLQVANLAEQAAERIKADPLLTRVGALYHDAGKAMNPFFFIENQLPGIPNPHDELEPAVSAETIIRHVPEGLELARKYRLPRRIHSFIAEHHGTMITRYQYAKAVEAASGDENQVDSTKFRYPGPRPRLRETAILMLADGCEARMRAERPKDESELRVLIKSVVENRLITGQLDNTDLTLRDLDTIVDSFTATLRGTYHPRIEYPKLEKLGSTKSETSPTVPLISRPATDGPLESQIDT